MSRSTKALVGLLSFLPMILVIGFFIMLFSYFPRFFEWENYEPAPQEVFGVIAPIFIVIMIMAIISLGLLIFFIIHLIRYKGMEPVERIIWILVFFFVGIVGYPIYWYMRIWRDEPGPL